MQPHSGLSSIGEVSVANCQSLGLLGFNLNASRHFSHSQGRPVLEVLTLGTGLAREWRKTEFCILPQLGAHSSSPHFLFPHRDQQ